MVLAGPAAHDKLTSLQAKGSNKISANSQEYFERRRKESAEIIKLNGSVELAL